MNSRNWIVRRLTPQGALDPSFGDGGKVTVDFGVHFSSFEATAIFAAQRNRIVFAGQLTSHRASGSAVGAFRRLEDGRLDPAYGANGTTVATFGRSTSHDDPAAAHLLPDGSLIVGGSIGESALALVRFTPAGKLDPTFGRSGRTTVAFPKDPSAPRPPFPQQVTDMSVSSEGRIVLLGSMDYDIPENGGWRFTSPPFLASFNANGMPDATFGTNGAAFPPASYWISHVDSAEPRLLLQDDDRIPVAMDTPDGILLSRLLGRAAAS